MDVGSRNTLNRESTNGVLDVDLVRWFAQATGSYTIAEQTAYNDFIIALKQNGWWDVLDFMKVPAKTRNDSLLDFRFPTGKAWSLAQEINAPVTWAEWVGFTCDATVSKGINLLYVPSTDKIVVTGTKGTMGFYRRTDNTLTSGYDMGSNTGGTGELWRMRVRDALNKGNCYPMGQATINPAGVTDGRGLWVMVRNGASGASNNGKLYKNGVYVAQATVVNANVWPTQPMGLGCVNSSGSFMTFTNHQYNLAFVGAFDDADMANFWSTVQTFLTAIGGI